MSQIRLRTHQGVLSLTTLFDIGIRGVPAQYPMFTIFKRHAARKKPAILAIRTSHAPLSFKNRACRQRMSPKWPELLAVLCVNCFEKPMVPHRIHTPPHIVQEAFIARVDGAIGCCTPNLLWNYL